MIIARSVATLENAESGFVGRCWSLTFVGFPVLTTKATVAFHLFDDGNILAMFMLEEAHRLLESYILDCSKETVIAFLKQDQAVLSTADEKPIGKHTGTHSVCNDIDRRAFVWHTDTGEHTMFYTLGAQKLIEFFVKAIEES